MLLLLTATSVISRRVLQKSIVSSIESNHQKALPSVVYPPYIEIFIIWAVYQTSYVNNHGTQRDMLNNQ